MRGNLVRTITPDGVELEGFLAETQTTGRNVSFLHMHGMFENFYLPLFIRPLYETAVANGYAFATVNTRAHDYFIYCRQWKNNKTFSWIQQGGSHEIFSNCILDIKGWLSYLEHIGQTPTILMGHSHGALKAAFYAAKESEDKRLSGLVLISPSDDVGLQKRELGDRYSEALKIAQNMVKEGKGNELMPSWVYGNPVSAVMYVDMFAPSSNLAMFRFDEPSQGFTMLHKINIPVLVIFGSDDKATSTVSSQKAIELVRSSLPKSYSVKGRILEGADHNYTGRESELARCIVEWANSEFT